MNIISTAKLL